MTVQQLARVIYDEFKSQGEYVGDYEFQYAGHTCLDGEFDLQKVAVAVLQALAEEELT